jgi:hypothetical protein
LSKNIEGNVWNVRLGVLDAMNQLATKSDLSTCLGREQLLMLLTSCFSTLHDLKYIAVRTSGVAAVKSIVGRSDVKKIVGDAAIADLKLQLGVLIGQEKVPVIEEEMKSLLTSL